VKKVRWEHYPHPADMGIRGFGRTKEEAFAQAALAITAIITDPQTVEPKESVQITCREQEDDLLLFDWLNALLYEMATRHVLFSRYDITIAGEQLKATAWGESIDIARHQPAVEVKAATFADLKVRREKDGNWVAQCIVDV
jgi:SHS2 domain-containing protein